MVATPQTKSGRYAPMNIQGLVDKYNLPWVTYDPSAFNHLHFSALDHVNGFGSLIVTLQMAKEIAKVMDLPVNQQKMADFSSLIFSDYQITNNGGDYRLELVPKNPDANLFYKWTLNGAKGKVYQTNWREDGFFEFQVPADGKYSIQVEIRNPNGKFSYSAVFKFDSLDSTGGE
jgi:hypothetical protein